LIKMKLLVVGLFILGLSSVKTESDDSAGTKKGKVFSLFSVVTFPNSQCTAKSDTTTYGTCFTATECTSKSGTTDGNCAAGFGVCCTFSTSTCGDGVTQNCTYISNPSYPTTYTTTGSCSHAITPVSSDICQIRLDFDNFDITEATATGLCTDSFSMTGPSGQNPLDLCGTLTGQHIYFENARSTSTSTVSFTIATGGTWKIKISQIECSSLARALPDCDQYVTGVTGVISSYNWGTIQLQNKDFTHCIRKEAGYCGVQLTQAQPNTSPNTFMLDDTSSGLAGNGKVAAITQGYITLPACGSNNGGCDYTGQMFTDGYTAIAADGQAYPGAVPLTNHLFVIHHTGYPVDQAATPAQVGFSLQWVQMPCGSVISRDVTTGYEGF